jgi:hypothetical protein
MITERFPELHGLDAEEKLILAGELWREATRPATASEPAELPKEIISMIEARLEDYLEHPESGISWATLKQRILSGANQ